MKKNLLQFFLFLAVFALSACSKEGKSGYSASYKTIQAQQSEDVSYKLIKQNVIYKDADSKNVIIYNKITGEKILDNIADENEVILNLAVSGQDKMFVIVRNNIENRIMVKVYDIFGNYISQNELSVKGEDSDVCVMAADNKDNIYIASQNALYVYSETGELKHEYNVNEVITNIFVVPDDKVYFLTFSDKEKSLYMILENSKEAEKVKSFSQQVKLLNCYNNIFYVENGKMNCFVKDSENQTVIDLADYDLIGMNLCSVEKLNDNSYVFVNEGENGIEIVSLTKKADNEEEIKKHELSIATLTTSSKYASYVSSFNKSNKEYIIKNGKYSDDSDTRQNQINASLAGTDAPDIVEVLSGACKDTLNEYVSKGYLESINSYIEKSDKIDLSGIIERVVEDFTIAGNLYTFPTDFSFYTLAVPADSIGDIETWNIEEFLDYCEQNPQLYIEPDWTALDSKKCILDIAMLNGIYGFVDFGEGKADFDNERFRDILNRINALNITQVTLSGEDRSAAGENVIWRKYIYSARDFEKLEWQNGGGRQLKLIGFPSGNEQRSAGIMSYGSLVAITADSQYKDVAWEFLEAVLSGAFTESSTGQFVTGKEALEATLAKEVEKEYIKDSDGNYVLDENGDKIADVTYVNGRAVEPMTTRQVDEVRTAIENAVFYNNLERDCIAIVCEEAGQFMENSKTIDETIEIIQNRVQLMLDERK